MGNINLKMPPTKAQIDAMVKTRTFFCIPSFIGSAFIVYHVLKNKERRTKMVKTRILLCMSIMDILYTTATFCNFFLPPPPHFQRPERALEAFDPGTASNIACTTIGFFTQGGRLSSIMYNCALTTYYLLLIRYGWKETRIKATAEPYLHILPQLLGWSTAITGVATQNFNPTPTGCDFDSFPPGCFGDPRWCTRSVNALEFLKYLFFYPLWLAWVFLAVAMILIYLKIRAVEHNINRHNTVLAIAQRSNTRKKKSTMMNSIISRASSSIEIHFSERNISIPDPNPTVAADLTASAVAKKHEKSRNFATQALFYCIAFGVSWICFSIQMSIVFWDPPPNHTILLFLSNVLAPLQGLWNAIVYIRTQYLSQRRKQKRQQQERRRADLLEDENRQHATDDSERGIISEAESRVSAEPSDPNSS